MRSKIVKRTKGQSFIIASVVGTTWAIMTILLYAIFQNDLMVGVIAGLSGGILSFTIWYLLDRFIQKSK